MYGEIIATAQNRNLAQKGAEFSGSPLNMIGSTIGKAGNTLAISSGPQKVFLGLYSRRSDQLACIFYPGHGDHDLLGRLARRGNRSHGGIA